MHSLFFVFIALPLIVWGEERQLYVNDKLLRLEPLTAEHIQYLQDLETNTPIDFWTDVVAANRTIDVHIAANEYDRYVAEFQKRSLPFHILVDDIQQIIDEEQRQLVADHLNRQIKSRLLGQSRIDIAGTYASYNDMVTFIQEKAAADPSHVKVLDIGGTYEGRSIKAVSLQFNPASTRNIWIDCGIHAREWITPAVCIWMVDKLIAEYNNNDATTRQLLNYWTVYIAPSLNPDGYEYSRTSSRLWRKSRTRAVSSVCPGVDLNRNYPTQWMTGGSSSSTCSETYAGPSAGSEIETKGVVNFLTSKKGTWDMYMSFHSYGQWWFTPYGYKTASPPDYNRQMAVARIGADAIRSVTSNRVYTLGTVAQLLYIASGSTVDWAYETLQIRFTYTIELPPIDGTSNGFVLPPQQAPGVCHETYVGMKAFLVAVKNEVSGA